MSTSRWMVTRGTGVVLAAGLALAWSSTSAAAQQVDSRWLPWLGCWEAVGESGSAMGDAMFCVRPSGSDTGVALLTVAADGSISSEESMRADGSSVAFDAEGCEGTQRAQFSTDATRVYVQSEQVCEGGSSRTSSGVFAMVTPYEWTDVEAVTVAGESSAWTLRYRAASEERVQAAGFGDVLSGRLLAVRSARIAAARTPDVDDVLDVYQHAGAEATQAWVVEMDSPMEVDAHALVGMADAGLPDDVIDAVVAVSYPTRFAVDRNSGISELAPDRDADYAERYPYYSPYGPFGWSPFYYRGFNPYGYGYGGYGYGGYGGYGGYYGYYRPSVIVIEPRGESMRVVNGRGWTRSSSSSSGPSTGRTSRPSSGSRPSTSSGSSGGSVSRGGSSSSGGSSGGSTGRTAKRRGGGEL